MNKNDNNIYNSTLNEVNEERILLTKEEKIERKKIANHKHYMKVTKVKRELKKQLKKIDNVK